MTELTLFDAKTVSLTRAEEASLRAANMLNGARSLERLFQLVLLSALATGLFWAIS